MKLRKLHIEDYKMFKDFDIDFLDEEDKPLDIVVLAGVNGSGKTSLLELVGIVEKVESIFNINIGREYTLKKRLTEKDIYEFLNKDNELKSLYQFSAESDMDYFSKNIVYLPSGIDDTKKVADEFVKTFYFFLKEKDYRPSEITEYFNQYMKEIFIDLDIGFKYSHLDKDDKVWFTSNDRDGYYYTHKGNDEKIIFTIDELSTGQKTLLSKILYIYFKDYKDKVILIDEPELSLHPKWQSQVLSVYEKLAEKNNCQIIIATHSPQIIASAKNEYLRFLVKEDEKIIAKKLNTSPLDRDMNTIVKTIMGADYLPKQIEELQTKYRELFDQGLENSSEAKELEKEILEWESPNSSFWQSIAFDRELRSI